MKRQDLRDLEGQIMKEVVRRRSLGGYSADAEGILILGETMLRVLQHMIEEYPEEAKEEKHDTRNKAAHAKLRVAPDRN